MKGTVGSHHLIMVAAIIYCNVTANYCSMFIRYQDHLHPGRLDGGRYETKERVTAIACCLCCNEDFQCRSVNYNRGRKSCELNDKSVGDIDAHYDEEDGWIMYEKEMVNLALRKPAYQSALWDIWTDASCAVDGNKDTNMLVSKSCSYTGSLLLYNWWYVDILEVAIVYEVRITNRGDYGYRLRDLSILVGETLGSLQICGYFPGPGEDGKEYRITCGQPLTGRFIKIQKESDGSLAMCEVEVMGMIAFNS